MKAQRDGLEENKRLRGMLRVSRALRLVDLDIQ